MMDGWGCYMLQYHTYPRMFTLSLGKLGKWMGGHLYVCFAKSAKRMHGDVRAVRSSRPMLHAIWSKPMA